MKTVLHARTHSVLHVPAVGDLGSVFPSINKTLSNLSMFHDGNVLTISFNIGAKGRFSLDIPLANVAHMQTKVEESEKAKDAA